ncbi:polymer-forming cytoskeletal protein [Hazenella sp. IB182357]|uniref:Polymer-forming cytoskeletal protein n=1 Tax=Polycladospora coralii TaxID=2771432 RepID=A0A926RTW6_9BACL|nr:polymer-forming cytoskeletal protein [Polycladospora coralii]MBD1371852.1 polymer-forming cytoskeletal protein [Polycladospora coralii]MBS7529313.1 polymer-forming cytoskeletal protein [Polycladospora coralii]
MRKVFTFMFKWFFILVLVGAILIGFSFIERGEIAKHIAQEFHLPYEQTQRMVERPIQEGWSEETDGSVRVDREVTRDFQVSTITIGDDAVLAGDVTASESVIIEDGLVRGNINAKQIIVGLEERRHYDEDTDRDKGVWGNVIGEQIQIRDASVVMGDVGKETSTVHIGGHVSGDVQGKKVILEQTAVIDGNISLAGEVLIMEPGAEVRGAIITPENKPLSIVKQVPDSSPGDHGKGHDEGDVDENNIYYERDSDNAFGLWLLFVVGIVSLTTLVYVFARSELDETGHSIITSPWKMLWKGFLTALLSLPLLFVLAVSVLGIPLAIIYAIGLLLATAMGLIAIAQIIGTKVGDTLQFKTEKQLLLLLLGILLIVHLIWIPILGWLLLMGGLLLGLGSVTERWFPKIKASWRSFRQKKSDHK